MRSIALNIKRNDLYMSRKPFPPHTFYKLPIDKCFADYMISKRITKKPAYSITDALSQSSIKVSLRIENERLHFADERLARSREEYNEKRKVLQNEFKELLNTAKILKINFLQMETFIRENQEKRERTMKGHQLIIYQRIIDIEELGEDIKKWQAAKRVFDKLLRRYKFYEHYLEKVVEFTSDFKDCNAIIKRYQAIQEARSITQRKQDNDTKAAMENIANLHSRLVTNNINIGTLKNRAYELNRRYNESHQRSLNWENTVQSVTSQINSITGETARMHMACWMLYTLMCKRQNKGITITAGEYDEQLQSIKKMLMNTEKIIHMVKGVHHKKRKET